MPLAFHDGTSTKQFITNNSVEPQGRIRAVMSTAMP
jgi:hypothetical protein